MPFHHGLSETLRLVSHNSNKGGFVLGVKLIHDGGSLCEKLGRSCAL